MDQDLMNAWKGLAEYGDNLDFATKQLMALFPDSLGWLAWQDAIFRAQNDYCSPGDASSDLRLQIAEHWLDLAKAGCLDVQIDPSKGLVIREKSLDAAQRLQLKDLEKVLFKLLERLPDERWLPYQDIFAALDAMTGQSLRDYLDEFGDLVNHLTEKRYIVWNDMSGRKLPRFRKGLDFDEWSRVMSKPPTPAQPGHVFNFNAPVGAVQSGDYAVANVQQTAGSSDYGALIGALKAAQAEFAAAELPSDDREEAREHLQVVIEEVQKEKPNRLSLKSLLSGVAATVQTLGSSSEAYKAVVAALRGLGISL